MTSHHLLKNGNGADSRRGFEEGDDLGLEEVLEGIWPPAAARLLLLGWQPGIVGEAISGGSAEGCLRGGGRDGVGLEQLHKKPHLMIGYMAARHKVIPLVWKTTAIPGRPRSADISPSRKLRRGDGHNCVQVTPSRRHSLRRRFSS